MKNKQDLEMWMESMIPKDNEYLSQSSASYIKPIQNLESILRPLWGIFPDYFSGNKSALNKSKIAELQHLVEQNQMPKITTQNRQIAVELGVVAYALGTYQNDFLNLFSKDGQVRLIKWLNEINHIEIPEGNWFFFLVLVNASLKRNQLQYSQTKLTLGLQKIDSFYVGNGWYTDGPGKQLDYYVSFAFHFYGMIYTRWFNDECSEKFDQRTVIFSNQFQYWFDDVGRSIPFGRSLTYRFAHVSFWSGLVVSGIYKRTQFTLGQIKNIIFNNFRFWRTKPITVPKQNNLSIGYGYAQQLMSEDYNAPGSPMWAFKSLILLELPRDSEFWTVPEEPLVKHEQVVQKEPGFIINSSHGQTVALSLKQEPKSSDLYFGTEKYCKFAYSTYFGFNISRKKTGINNMAIDSTLMFSIPGHDDYFARKKIDSYYVNKEYGMCTWHLWDDVQIKTYLIPIDGESHVRIHEIKANIALTMLEGSFSLPCWNQKYDVPIEDDSTSKIKNQYGISAIVDLLGGRKPSVSQQGPNTNIYYPDKNAIPILKDEIAPSTQVVSCLCVGSSDSEYNLPEVSIEVMEDKFILSVSGIKRKIPRN